MRDIEFKAKRKDNGEWVHGDLLTAENQTVCAIKERTSSAPTYLVDSKTVSQYIGLKDRNGVKIFEGDIVALFSNVDEVYAVEFDKCCFQLHNGTMFCVMDSFYEHKLEIVGNIHDSLELLKGIDE